MKEKWERIQVKVIRYIFTCEYILIVGNNEVVSDWKS